MDSGSTPLAAYQIEFTATNGIARIVGIEGGAHPAFRQPPFYDPKAIQHEHVIIASFSTANAADLPTGKTASPPSITRLQTPDRPGLN